MVYGRSCKSCAAFARLKVDKSAFSCQKFVIQIKLQYKEPKIAQNRNFGNFWSNQLLKIEKTCQKGATVPSATKIVSFVFFIKKGPVNRLLYVLMCIFLFLALICPVHTTKIVEINENQEKLLFLISERGKSWILCVGHFWAPETPSYRSDTPCHISIFWHGVIPPFRYSEFWGGIMQ